MNTLNAKVKLMEKVIHIAFGCGCVRTFHVEQEHPDVVACPEHGDMILSSTEEYRERAA
jgi:hypothetical protein